MSSSRPEVKIDREALGAAIEEVEEVLTLLDLAPRLPSEDPQDFVRVLREAGESDVR